VGAYFVGTYFARGALTEAELDDLLKSLRRHLEDPNTRVVFDLFFQARDRKRVG
jgi:hypothetical protein